MIKTKFKPILPSLREKKRYIVFEVVSKEKVQDFVSVTNAIWHCILQFLGQFGAAKAGVILLSNKWDMNLQRGILKVNHSCVDDIKAALTFITQINNIDVIFRSLGISGILKKAEKNYLKGGTD